MQPVKNKKLTYLLICAVAVVWGVVLYRVFFKGGEDDYKLKEQPIVDKHELYDQYVLHRDTFKLALNYRDPFLGLPEAPPKVTDVGSTNNTNFIPPPVKPAIDWSAIKYSGYIINPVTKKIITILVVRGKEQMVSDGELFEGVKLLKNKRDSILVFWQGKQKHIKQ